MQYKHCTHCGKLITVNTQFCPYCGAKQLVIHNQRPVYYPPRKRHHYVLWTSAIVILLALGFGGAYVHKTGMKNTTQQASNVIHHKKINDSVTNPSRPSKPTNKPGYTLSVLPSNIQGTWYSYDEDGLETLTITPTTITQDGQTVTVHARYKDTNALKSAQHPKWVVAVPAKYAVRGLNFVNLRGWNQGAGDGTDFATFNHNGTVVLDEAGGAEAATNANFYKSKAQAKQFKKQIFKGNGEKSND